MKSKFTELVVFKVTKSMKREMLTWIDTVGGGRSLGSCFREAATAHFRLSTPVPRYSRKSPSRRRRSRFARLID